MSNIWPHATKKNPCPICGKPDWCQFGEKAMKCMRVESEHPCSTGGFYHFYEHAQFTPTSLPKSKAAPKSLPAANIIKELRKHTTIMQFEQEADALGILKEALIAVGAAYHPEKKAWAYPMHDSTGDVVGIRLRSSINGFKWAMEGSRNGLFMPIPAVKLQGIVFAPEGATDTAACLSLGLYGIGRPTATSGNDILALALDRLEIRKLVIVTDNDDIKRLGNREGRPGIEGAIKLKRDLRIPSVIWMPPSPLKDIREFVKRGGTAEQILAEVNQKPFTR